MFREVHVNTSMEEECSRTMSGLVKKLIGKKEVNGTSMELLKKQTYNLMKQLARKIVYHQTNQSVNGETKTELTQKTEFSMRESVYTLIRKKAKRKKKECKSQVLKENTRSLHYSNVCEIKNNTTKLIRNKLTLQEKSKKIVKKRTSNREKSLVGKIESMEKLLSSWKKDFKRKPIVEALKWSMKSTYKSIVMQNEIMEQQIKPVPIVPPLPLPMWAKALDEPPQTVILRRTPSLNSLFDPRTLRSKVIMRRRMRNGSRKAKACMISADSLARALAGPKWSKGPRQVPVSTFQATRIHYRFLLAKYGKSRLMGRQRVYPNCIKSNVHSSFSVINLLHDVEEAISQNKYSKEADKIVKNFKEELNKDLLYNEPINRKYNKYQVGNSNNSSTRKRGKMSKQFSGITLSDLVEKLGGNDSKESFNGIESDREVKSENCIETGQLQNLDTDNPVINALVDKDSKCELFKSLNNEILITDASNKLKNNPEDIDVSKISQNKKFIFKEKTTLKKKKALIKEPKPENISEEERLSAILQDLKKQVKASEMPTPLILTKNDSLTELNFQKEPRTYLSMHPSTTTLNNSDSQTSHLETATQKECSTAELSEQESKQSLLPSSEPTPPIKKNNPPKSEHSSTKSYTFRIDSECIKNKPMNICNIITALERVNKLLQNIPIQYDKNTGRPYLVYDPKTIVKVIKEVNIKHEYKMVVKKYNKKAKIDLDTKKCLYETNSLNTKIETTVKQDEKGLEDVGNQLIKCIMNSIKPSNLNECISCGKHKEEFNKYSQTFEPENSTENHKFDQSLVDFTDRRQISQQTDPTESLKSPDKNMETIQYKKKFFEQVIKTSISYHFPGIYGQAIIYEEKQEYFSIIQPIACCKDKSEAYEINLKRDEEKNINKFSTSSYAELKGKYKAEFRERKNVPRELSKKYGRHLKTENTNQTQANISQKYYQQYNKTRKLLLSKYEFKRNIKKESLEKGLNKPCLKTDLCENLSNEKNAETNSLNDLSLCNIVNKSGNTNQTIHIPNKLNIEKSNIFYEKNNKAMKDEEMIQCIKGKDVKNKKDYSRGQKTSYFNPVIAFDRMEKVINNKNDLLINAKNNSEGLGSFSLNKSIMNSMIRSVSINTIPNTFPIRKDITKQVFYFQITYPLFTDLNDINKKQSSQDLFKPFQHDIFNKFIYNKENSKLQTYKNYINQQVMDSLDIIKNDLNQNINDICQIVNIDNQLLIKFLKICLKQNELDFEENKKLILLENEMKELKSLMAENLGKKINSLRMIHRKQKRSNVRRYKKIKVIDNNSKIKQSILENETNMEDINMNQALNNNGQYNKPTYSLIEALNDIKNKQSTTGTTHSYDLFSKFDHHKENSKLKIQKNKVNQQVMDSVNTIKCDLNKNLNNVCKIVNIGNQLLIKFLNICLKQNELYFTDVVRSLILDKEMEELKSQMEELLGKATNPLRLIHRTHQESSISGCQNILKFDNLKIKPILKNYPNMEEIDTNKIMNKNRLCIEILRLLNFIMLIFSLISHFN